MHVLRLIKRRLFQLLMIAIGAFYCLPRCDRATAAADAKRRAFNPGRRAKIAAPSPGGR